nr:uncharacterized protein LOC113802316 [Penaeus vannamei]
MWRARLGSRLPPADTKMKYQRKTLILAYSRVGTDVGGQTDKLRGFEVHYTRPTAPPPPPPSRTAEVRTAARLATRPSASSPRPDCFRVCCRCGSSPCFSCWLSPLPSPPPRPCLAASAEVTTGVTTGVTTEVTTGVTTGVTTEAIMEGITVIMVDSAATSVCSMTNKTFLKICVTIPKAVIRAIH